MGLVSFLYSRPSHPRRRLHVQRQLTGEITVMTHQGKPDRKRFSLSKEVAATHGSTMERVALNLSLLNADKLQTSLWIWSIADVLECSLDGIGGLPQHTKAILHTLVTHSATPTYVRIPHR